MLGFLPWHNSARVFSLVWEWQFLVGPAPAWDCNQAIFRLCCCSVVVNGVNLVINNACTTLSVVVNGVNLVINNACHRGKTSCIKV